MGFQHLKELKALEQGGSDKINSGLLEYQKCTRDCAGCPGRDLNKQRCMGLNQTEPTNLFRKIKKSEKLTVQFEWGKHMHN